MTDSHCHLTACADPDAAASPELRALITVGTDLQDAERALELAERHPNVWVALGHHPNDAHSATPTARRQLAALVTHPKVVGVGETGFDTYWHSSPLGEQRELFFWHAELAAAHAKALVLHVRDESGGETASREAARCLAEAGLAGGILHCFNGHPELLETGLELGWYVSFAGNLTYKNAARLREVAAQVPAERLLVETDSPYLTPQPRRGERNVPHNVRYTAMTLAQVRGVTLEALERLTDDNAARVYGLAAGAPTAT
ncbi:TatD family hydrolase [Truepera radiovictrix]|uniref:Hydrolase, TatD family n=1 Tax=Truepera radiovictrix (strain DSM 17093 / CIP 108686 / LMG 22925 / RQ-24) TaxID=649638 RepID=D7CSM3_TRURR|nr:TatD family hydrolase [Truepera radiovictrix]ADI15443.1 hydrolase, TatD family [Truepera radiovictrix DSM 17093]WMT56007.1 TatD family hydrolase [Truepera radiovictrix]